jgi:hypothetical protein
MKGARPRSCGRVHADGILGAGITRAFHMLASAQIYLTEFAA